MKEYAVGILVAVLGILLSYSIFFKSDPTKFLYLSVAFVVLSIIISFYFKYREYKRISEIEEVFPDFLAALAEALKSGMTLMQAFKHVSTMRLGPLSDEVKKMYYKMSWGVPFPRVLREFAEDIKSEELRRAITIILQSYLSGGEMVSTLENLSESMKRLREIRKDIRVVLGEQVKVIYTINFLFMIILVIIYNVIVPLQIQAPGESLGLEIRIDTSKYKQLFILFAVVIGICSGLLVGVVAEGKVIAGFRHFSILVAMNLLIISYLFLKKNVSFDINLPGQVELGRVYEVRGYVYVEGSPCNGKILLKDFNIESKVVNGHFEFRIAFQEKGKKNLEFIITCEEGTFRKEVVVDVR